MVTVTEVRVWSGFLNSWDDQGSYHEVWIQADRTIHQLSVMKGLGETDYMTTLGRYNTTDVLAKLLNRRVVIHARMENIP